MTLILDDTAQQYGEFAAQLRSVNAASHRLTQGKVDILPLDSLRQLGAPQAAAPRAGPDDGDSVLAGVRTRSARGSMLPDTASSASPPPPARAEGGDPGVLVAVGPRAARAVVQRAGSEPVLLALLGRLEYEELRALPDDTLVYPGHEYTAANAAFALSVDPRNPALNIRAGEVKRQVEAGRYTVPVTLGMEKAANPFLRADQPAMAKAMGLPVGAPPANVFAALRKAKDEFKS